MASVRSFCKTIGEPKSNVFRLLSRGRNPAAYYRDHLIQLEYSELEIAEWFGFFETRIPAKFKKTEKKPLKRVRLIPIKENLNLDLTEEQAERISKLSEKVRNRISATLLLLKKAQDAGVLDAGASNKQLQRLIKSHNISGNHYLSIIQYKKVVKKIRDDGIQNFIENFEKIGTGRIGITKIEKDDLECFASLLMNDNCLSAQTAYKLTVGKAIESGRFNEENFPCEAAFVYWLNKTYGKEALERVRKGKDFHTRNHAAFVSKTAADLYPNQVLVGDCMKFDVWVKVPMAKFYEFGETPDSADKQLGYKPMRLEFTAWMDYKTHRIVGYKLHSAAQNTDHVLLSLKKAVSTFGSPQYLLVDNGKPYANKELGTSGKMRRRNRFGIDLSEKEKDVIEGVFTAMGINTRFCLPFNSDGKPIERMFSIIHREFDKLFFDYYAGVNKLRVPESTDKTINKGQNHDKMPTLEDFEKLLENYIDNTYNKRVFETGERSGKSPLHLWNIEYDAAKFKHYDDRQLALFLSRSTKMYTVSRHQINHGGYGLSYQSYELQEGQKVYLRIDPEERNTAWCYDESDRFVCAAKAKTIASAFAQTPEEYEILSKAIEEANRNNKQHKEKVAEVKRIAKSQDLSPETLLKYQENYTNYIAEIRNLDHSEKEFEKQYTNTHFAQDAQVALHQELQGVLPPDSNQMAVIRAQQTEPKIYFAINAEKEIYELTYKNGCTAGKDGTNG